jgi:septal ring factor EnvC (AmiA/AmiB activator)
MLKSLWQSPVSRVENGSFTATIRRLESKNEELADELDRAWSRSDALRAKVEEWEAWAEAMERQLTESQNLVAQLDEELRHVEGGMAEAVKLLQSFRPQEEVQSRGSEDWYQDATRSPSLSQEE